MTLRSPRNPTIFDLAQRSGLSKSTISAALLDNHSISAETRARVQRLAAEMGYARNAFAATLATHGRAKPMRSLDVAIVSHVPADGGYAGYEYSVIKKRLHELGYEAHHYDIFHHQIPCEKLRGMLFNQGYCGIIFDQIYERNSDLFSVDWNSFCLVCAGRVYHQPPCDIARSNITQAVSLAWREIRAAGYRRIGFALCRHQPLILDDSERESALWGCQQQVPGEKAVPSFLGAIGDRSSFEKWVRRHRPEVVVGFNSTHYYMLCQMGLRIPEDLAYANLHMAFGDEKMAGVDQSSAEIKIKAAEHLDFLVRHRRTGYPEQPWELLGPARWVAGETLPARSCGASLA